MSTNLMSINEPEGWPLVPLKQVTADVPNSDPSKSPDAGFSYIDISSIDNKSCAITSPKHLIGRQAPSRARRPVQKDDVLFSNVRTYLRNVAIVADPQGPTIASTGFTVLRPTARILPRYLYHLARSDYFISQVTPEQTGTQYPATSDRVVRNQMVPLPDLPTQRALVSAVDAAEEQRSAAMVHLANAERSIISCCEAVLAAACTGRLTAEWRDDNELQPVSELLAEIRADLARAGHRRSRVVAPDSARLDPLPSTWAWAAVGELAEVQLGGTPARNTPTYWGGEVPWVSSGEVANCRISATRETISAAGLAGSNAKLYPSGTVLIAMIGEGKTRGQAAILDISASTNQNVAGILPDSRIIDPEYLWRWALAQYEITRAAGRGGNQAALNAQKVRELLIPIPPIEEQQEIVRRADAYLDAVAAVLGQIRSASRQVGRSSQAMLTKAFRGELVPSDS